MEPQPIKKLVSLFSKFPTVGPRTAARFVYFLLKVPQKEVEEIAQALLHLKREIGTCSLCFNVFSNAGDSENTRLCEICRNKTRNSSLLCVVEKETDLEAIEKTKTYKGLYFVLGGTVGQLKKKEIEGIRAKELEERLKKSKIQEVILATNVTTEGETTALYLERVLKPLGVPTTRLGRGLPIGSELEYADEETLRHSIENRR